MPEYIYTVSDSINVIGSFPDIELATLFVKAYFAEYYNEYFGFRLTIRRVPKIEEKADDRKRV